MDSTTDDIIRLRTRLTDLQRCGGLNTEAFGLYQQTILQIYQEAERRKQSCFSQAQVLKQQAAASESQGHAFATIGSILFSVVNGYVDIEQKRVAEEKERVARESGTLPLVSASGEVYAQSEMVKPKRGRKKNVPPA